VEVPVWLNLLEGVVVLGLVIYVLVRESRTDERMAASSDPDGARRRAGALLPRLGARLIDEIPFWLIYTILGFVFDLGYAFAVVGVVVLYAYFVLLDSYVGTTVGKRLLGLRVIGPSGERLSIKQAAIREAFILVSASVGALPFVGQWLASLVWVALAWTISNSLTKQGRHDQMAGGTQVVTGRKVRTSA
jgi:uncharacterized RDD family membrane protein YckC